MMRFDRDGGEPEFERALDRPAEPLEARTVSPNTRHSQGSERPPSADDIAEVRQQELMAFPWGLQLSRNWQEQGFEQGLVSVSSVRSGLSASARRAKNRPEIRDEKAEQIRGRLQYQSLARNTAGPK